MLHTGSVALATRRSGDAPLKHVAECLTRSPDPPTESESDSESRVRITHSNSGLAVGFLLSALERRAALGFARSRSPRRAPSLTLLLLLPAAPPAERARTRNSCAGFAPSRLRAQPRHTTHDTQQASCSLCCSGSTLESRLETLESPVDCSFSQFALGARINFGNLRGIRAGNWQLLGLGSAAARMLKASANCSLLTAHCKLHTRAEQPEASAKPGELSNWSRPRIQAERPSDWLDANPVAIRLAHTESS